jgi:hypothetical protein
LSFDVDGAVGMATTTDVDTKEKEVVFDGVIVIVDVIVVLSVDVAVDGAFVESEVAFVTCVVKEHADNDALFSWQLQIRGAAKHSCAVNSTSHNWSSSTHETIGFVALSHLLQIALIFDLKF